MLQGCSCGNSARTSLLRSTLVYRHTWRRADQHLHVKYFFDGKIRKNRFNKSLKYFLPKIWYIIITVDDAGSLQPDLWR